MKKIILSAKSFNTLSRDPNGPKSQRVWFSDHQGLGVDLGKTKRSIFYKYKSPEMGKFRTITLDSFTYTQKIDVGIIEDILVYYYKTRNKIRADIDPLAEKDSERSARKQAEQENKQAIREKEALANTKLYTLNAAFDTYTQHRLFTEEIAASSQKGYTDCYNNHISPALGRMALVDIEQGDIEDFLDEQKDSVCNMAIAVLMRIQKVAMRGKDRKISKPFIFGMERRSIGTRSRIIEDLPAFLNFLHDNEQYTSYRNALHTQLLYGCRATEIYGIQWNEVHENEIHISWERVKNRRISKKQYDPLIIPILPAMRQILEQQKRFSDICVFPQLRKDKSVNNGDIYRFLKRNSFKFSSHDIRRTVATTLRGLDGISIDDVDIVLDHSVTGVNQSYLTVKPLIRKRQILLRWHTHLSELYSPGITHIKTVSGGAK